MISPLREIIAVILLLFFHIASISAFSLKRALVPTVQTPSPEYVRLLNHSILFYEAQRSGKLPADNRISWRHDSALTDGSDVNIDLTGGYYDAGDYLKFTFPLSYTIFMLSWGGTDYIEGYQMANQTDYLKSQIKWATDWLIKAHPQPSTLFVQVGDTKVDNNYFGPDTGILLPRPSYQINETNFGTDAASMAATAFASASTFFRNLATTGAGNDDDVIYADILLVHATQLFNASHNILPYTKYQASVPEIFTVYGSTDYMDDLVLSGLAMYRATQNQTYLNDALQIYKAAPGLNNHSEPLDWDNKWGALYVLFAEIMFNGTDQNEALSRRVDAENYLDGIVSGLTANKTSGGLLFWDFYSNDNSNQNAMSAAHLLLSYSANILRPMSEQNTTDKDTILAKIKRYEDLANSQLNYVFGNNPMKQNYIVGERSNSPKYPHSAPASGFASLADAINNPTDLSHAHIIYGALVGGPAKNDSFTDVRLDWSQTEVALDYNAPYQNLLAYQVMFNPDNPFYDPKTSKPMNPDEAMTTNSKSSSIPSWGIALAVVLPLLLILALIALLLIRRRRRNAGKKQQGANTKEEMEQLGINEKAADSTSTFVADNKNMMPTAAEHQASSSAATLGANNVDSVKKEEV